jgi:hypothetical protein
VRRDFETPADLAGPGEAGPRSVSGSDPTRHLKQVSHLGDGSRLREQDPSPKLPKPHLNVLSRRCRSQIAWPPKAASQVSAVFVSFAFFVVQRS